MDQGETRPETRFTFRPAWGHYALAVAISTISAPVGILFMVAGAMCDRQSCSGESIVGWGLIGVSIASSVAAWIIAGRIIKFRAAANPLNNDGSALKLIFASLLAFLPWIVTSLFIYADGYYLEDRLPGFFFLVSLLAATIIRLAWGMWAGTLRRAGAPYFLLALPLAMLFGGALLQERTVIAADREFDNYQPTPAQRQEQSIASLQAFGQQLAAAQRDSTRYDGQLLDLNDRRVLTIWFQGKNARPPLGKIDISYARDASRRNAILAARIGESEFLWHFEISKSGRLSVGTHCTGAPACGGDVVPGPISFIDWQLDPDRCVELKKRPTSWCSKGTGRSAVISESPPPQIASLRGRADALPWTQVASASGESNDLSSVAEPGTDWLASFSHRLQFRQTAELWEHDRFADFQVDWRLNQLVNNPTEIPREAKLRYGLFPRQRRALMALTYKGSTFIWDFHSPVSGRWVVHTYCNGQPMCGKVSPALQGFSTGGEKVDACAGLREHPERWCGSTPSSDTPRVGSLSRAVKLRLRRSPHVSERYRQHPTPKQDNALDAESDLDQEWVAKLTKAIGVMQGVSHSGSREFDDYSDPAVQRMIKNTSAWEQLPSGVEVTGDTARGRRDALVLITRGKSEFLIDFQTVFDDMGARVFCRGSSVCGLVEPDHHDFKIRGNRGRACRAIASNHDLWCGYDYKRQKAKTMRLPHDLRARYRRLKDDGG